MTQLTDNVFAVEVPDGAANFEICNYGMNDALEYDCPQGHEVTDLPPGSWQLLCTTREASDEQAKGIVGSSEWYFPARHTRYIDYAHPVYENNKQAWAHGFGKAVESLNSLLASKGLDMNKNYVLLKKDVR